MKVVLATGRKAEGMVTAAVKTANAPHVTCEVLTQDLNIAAFSTPKSLKKALEGAPKKLDCDLILISGFCKADFSDLENKIAIPIRLGPRHAYDIGEAFELGETMDFSSTIPADVFLAEKRKVRAKQQLNELESNARGVF